MTMMNENLAAFEDSSPLGCYTVWTGMSEMITVPSSSGSSNSKKSSNYLPAATSVTTQKTESSAALL
jgi:hypothetical protein